MGYRELIERPRKTSLSDTDIIEVLDKDTPGMRRMTISDLLSGVVREDSDERLNIADTEETIATAAASGTEGQICWDSDYIYVCVGTDTWKRVAISSW